MAHKTSGQIGPADAWLGNNPKLNQRLDKLNGLVDWTPFEKFLGVIYASAEGRPSHPVLLLFKALLLQTWYTLSQRDMIALHRILFIKSFLSSTEMLNKKELQALQKADVRIVLRKAFESFSYCPLIFFDNAEL